MSTRLMIDDAGRVAIPERLLEKLNLQAGDSLEMESTGEQITLRPILESGRLVEESGVWVFDSGEPLAASDTDAMHKEIREQRQAANLGIEE